MRRTWLKLDFMKPRLEQLPSTMSPSQKIASLAAPHQLKLQLTQQSQQDQRNQPILPTQQNPPTQQNLPTQPIRPTQPIQQSRHHLWLRRQRQNLTWAQLLEYWLVFQKTSRMKCKLCTAVWNECPREMKSILLAAFNTLSILWSSLNH